MSRNITVAYKEVKSFFDIPINGSQKPSGVEGVLLIALMETLGMNYNLISAPDFESGRMNENGSWTGMAGLVQTGKADIAMSMVPTYDRSKVMDFTVPYLFSSINFATELPKMLPRVYAYVYTFDKTTWASLFSLILVVSPVVVLALFRTWHISKEWLNMFGNVLGRSVPQKVSGPPQVIFFVFWWFGTMIISFGYSSLFLSCLSVPPLSVPPKDFYQLAHVVEKGEYKVFVQRISSLRRMLESHRSAEVKSIAAAIVRNDWFYVAENYKKVVDKTAVIGSATHNRMQFGKFPYITKYQSDGIMLFYIGIAVNKGLSDLKAKLDRLLLRVEQAGLFEKYLQDVFFRKWILTYDEESSEQMSPLSFDELYGAFSILASGWFLSGVVLILEWSYYKRRNRIISLASRQKRESAFLIG